jgi:hypothetical protein
MNPLFLIAAVGISLPILAHLLNNHKYKETSWAAMQFLNKNVRVRAKEIRLRDLLLLICRCLAVLLLVFAVSQPAMKAEEGLAEQIGEHRAGVIIALDVSYSMMHSDGKQTRFEKALDKINTLSENIHEGDPVTLILLGTEHKVILNNRSFNKERFKTVLEAQKPTPESLDLNSIPRKLKELVDAMQAPQKEIYIITDTQEQDWQKGATRLQNAFTELSESAKVFLIPIQGDQSNLAITSLELVSGVLRKGTTARYSATVRNYGSNAVTNVKVTAQVNNITVDSKIIPSIAARSSETLNLFVPFLNSGAARITAKLDSDSLEIDNTRRTVAIIRDKVSVLCVENSSNASQSVGFISSALKSRDKASSDKNFSVQTVSWVSLPTLDLNNFDVVILEGVPAITSEQVKSFDKYVRKGNGLVWFPGDKLKIKSWAKASALLPASIEQMVTSNKTQGIGNPLSPHIPDHLVTRALLSLSDDLFSEAHFLKLLQVKPSANSATLLSLSGTNQPLLLEHSVGRGQVFMFTTSTDSHWNNMAITPIFPMLLQQMVTYLTAREFEKPRTVGGSLSLSYVDQPDATDAVFDTPSGKTITVAVKEKHNQYVAVLEHAHEVGFYLAKVSVQSPGMPVAVNVDSKESDIKCLTDADLDESFKDTGISILRSDADLLAAIDESRSVVSYWRFLMMACLFFLIIESLLAKRMLKKPASLAREGV